MPGRAELPSFPMMKAVVLEEFGSAPVLRSVERPLPAPGEIVVRAAASGVNPLDLKSSPALDQQPYDPTTAGEAHRAVANGTARGKVVIRVASEQR
jgi:hypothetical protein